MAFFERNHPSVFEFFLLMVAEGCIVACLDVLQLTHAAVATVKKFDVLDLCSDTSGILTKRTSVHAW